MEDNAKIWTSVLPLRCLICAKSYLWRFMGACECTYTGIDRFREAETAVIRPDSACHISSTPAANLSKSEPLRTLAAAPSTHIHHRQNMPFPFLFMPLFSYQEPRSMFFFALVITRLFLIFSFLTMFSYSAASFKAGVCWIYIMS